MLVVLARLQLAQLEAVLGDRVGDPGEIGIVVRVDLLAQHLALERPKSLSVALGTRRERNHRAGQASSARIGIPVEVLGGVGLFEDRPFPPRPGVKPRLGVDGRHVVQQLVGVGVVVGVVGQGLGVPLLDHAKATKLPLRAIEVAVVVGVAGHERPARDCVGAGHRGQTMHGKRQAGGPGRAGLAIGEVPGRRGLVRHLDDPAHRVVDAGQQVGLALGHQSHVAQGCAAIAGQGRRPQQARRAIAKQVGDLHRRRIRETTHTGHDDRFAKGVARPVRPVADLPRTDVHQVRRARTIHVRQPDPSWIEHLGVVGRG